MKPAPFKYYAPILVDEAVGLLAEYGPQDGRVIAGGQSLIPTMAFRMARPSFLVDINGIAELAKIDIGPEVLRIPACVRHATFQGDAVHGPTGALLRKVVHYIAHYPIRVRGTFCGSVANADPASEWCCTTVALDGTIIARSARGTRRILAKDFYKGVMTTDLREDELITGVELPLLKEGTRVGFSEFSRRAGDFAIVMVLAAYRLQNGCIFEPRISIGGAEAVPRRISDAESALLGREISASSFERAAKIAAEVVQPFNDNNNTIDFRRSLVRTLTRRALESAA
jgi:carbon-monoxide dehydrogenase medium subunit